MDTGLTRRRGPGQMVVDEMGAGPPLIFVHGLGSSGAAAWPAQWPLAERWRLVFPHRPGYDESPRAGREDFAVDAGYVSELLGDGAHLVGHSYGAVVALLAAARRPRAVWSLTSIEPPASRAARGDPEVDAWAEALEALNAAPLTDPEAFVRSFFHLADPASQLPPSLPPDLLGIAGYIHDHLRSPTEADIPTDVLMAATFPKLFVSGGHNPPYEAICDELALQVGGDRKLIRGAGHAAHMVGEYFNQVLEAFMAAKPLP